jgi:hypothetical protein
MSGRLTDYVNLRTTAAQRAFLEEYGYEKRLSIGGAVRDLIDKAMENGVRRPID